MEIDHRRPVGPWLHGAGGLSNCVAVEKQHPKGLIEPDERLSESDPVARLCSMLVNYFCVILELHVVAVLINEIFVVLSTVAVSQL